MLRDPSHNVPKYYHVKNGLYLNALVQLNAIRACTVAYTLIYPSPERRKPSRYGRESTTPPPQKNCWRQAINKMELIAHSLPHVEQINPHLVVSSFQGRWILLICRMI